MGKLQHKRKPNNQHSTKISSQQTNRIRNPTRNDPFTRKKTQQKILENNQQKNQRTPKKRERPTRLLGPRPKTKQLATPMFHEEPLAIGSAFPLDGINRGNRNSGYL